MAEQCGAMCRVTGNTTGGLRASLGQYKVLLTNCPCRREGSRPAPQASECNQLLDILCQQHNFLRKPVDSKYGPLQTQDNTVLLGLSSGNKAAGGCVLVGMKAAL